MLVSGHKEQLRTTTKKVPRENPAPCRLVQVKHPNTYCVSSVHTVNKQLVTIGGHASHL